MKRPTYDIVFLVCTSLILNLNSAFVVVGLGATLREYTNALRAERSNDSKSRRRRDVGGDTEISSQNFLLSPIERATNRQRRPLWHALLSKWRRGGKKSGESVMLDEKYGQDNPGTNSSRSSVNTKCILDASKKDLYISTTRSWVKKWVAGNNLCPWAAATLQGSKLKVTVVVNDDICEYDDDDDDDDDAKIGIEPSQYGKLNVLEASRKAVLQEVKHLCKASTAISHEDSHSTTLICLPDFVDFEQYLKLVALVDESLVSTGADRLVQLATFHPNYQFEGCTEEDVSNYTNRSPYPIIHLLKVSEVRHAIDQYDGDTKQIYLRNKEVMRQMAEENKLEALFEEFRM